LFCYLHHYFTFGQQTDVVPSVRLVCCAFSLEYCRNWQPTAVHCRMCWYSCVT